jgi:tetratricopeptide (TPR) repeat protein
MRIRGFVAVCALLLVGSGCQKKTAPVSPDDANGGAKAGSKQSEPLDETSGAMAGHEEPQLESTAPRKRPAPAKVSSREEAIAAVIGGNPEGAKDFLVAFLPKHAKDTDARLALARAQIMMGAYADADATLADKAGTPNDANVVLMRVDTMRRRGKLADALALLQAAHKRDAKSLPIRGELLATMVENGAEPADMLALNDKIYDAFEAGEAKTAADLLAVAQAALARGSTGAFQDANDVLGDAEEKAPVKEGSWVADRVLLRRGLMFLEKYQTEEALETFAILLERDPWHPDALTGSARVYADSLQFAAASRFAEEALQVNPRNPDAHAVLARVALVEGRRDEARKRIDEHVLAVNPEHTQGLATAGALSIMEFDKAGYTKARDGAVSPNPRNGEFYKELSDALGLLHLYPEADEVLREGVERAPKDPSVHAAMGLNLLRLGDEKKALAELELAWKRDRFNERTRNTLDLYEKSIAEHYSERKVGDLIVRLPKEDREFIEGGLVEAVKDSRDALDKGYHTKAGELRLEFFREPDEFSIRTVGVPSLGAVAVCFGPVITFIGPYHGMHNIDNVVRHEMAHVYAIRLSKGRVPRWFTEGLSEWESELADASFARESAELLQQARKAGKLRRLSELELAFIRAESPAMMEVAYSTAAYAVRYLGTKYGRDKLVKVLEGYGRGKETDALFKEHLGKGLPEIEKEFETWFYGQLDKTVTGWVPTPDAKKRDERDDLFKRAIGQLTEKDRSAAIRTLEELVSRDGDGFATRMMLAKLVADGPKPQLAKRHLEAARKFHKESVEPLVMLAELDRQAGDAAAEKAHLNAALEVDGDSLEPAARLLMLGLVTNDDKAIALALRRTRGTAPLHPITLAGRAVVLAKGGKKEEASKLLARTKKALEGTEGGPADTFVVAALAGMELGDKAFAQAMAKTALKQGKLPDVAKKKLAMIK